jgi:hypothetical protein
VNHRFTINRRFGCALLTVTLLQALASPAVRCQTYHELSLEPPHDAVRRRHARGVDLESDLAAVVDYHHAAVGSERET